MIDELDGATTLQPDEKTGLKFKHITTRAELDHLEQANIQNGIEWMRRSKRTDLLSEGYLKDLHLKLFGEVWSWAGEFRRTEKNIGVDPLHIGVELRNLLDDMRYWVDNRTYSQIEAVMRFHHRLVFIHPFPNGNGRHARIMADAIMLKILKHPTIDWAGSSSGNITAERRGEYLQALRAADSGDYMALLAFAGVFKKK